MATPYRAHGELGATLPDPSRPRLALGLVAVGGALSFASLTTLYFRAWDSTLAVMLALGGAGIILGLGVAGVSNRSVVATVAALVLATAYMNTGVWVAVTGYAMPAVLTWPIRYASIATGAVALLVIHRRLQRRSFGFPLRLAAAVGAHWAIVRAIALYVPGAERCAEVELLARSSWLLLGVGAWELRRYIGVAIPAEPASNDLGPVASTRLAVSMLSFSVRLALLLGTADALARRTCGLAADLVCIAIALAVEVPMLARVAPRRVAVVGTLAALSLTSLLVLAVSATRFVLVAPMIQLAPALALAVVVRRRQSEHFRPAAIALGLHVVTAVVNVVVLASFDPPSNGLY